MDSEGRSCDANDSRLSAWGLIFSANLELCHNQLAFSVMSQETIVLKLLLSLSAMGIRHNRVFVNDLVESGSPYPGALRMSEVSEALFETAMTWHNL